MTEIITKYGTVTIGPASVAIRASRSELLAWRDSPGQLFPCAGFGRPEELTVLFVGTGLSEMDSRPAGAWAAVDPNDLRAWASSILAEILDADHPCRPALSPLG